MIRFVQFALWALLIATPTVSGEDQGTCLDALRKMFPDSGSALNSAAKWLEDNYGAATADDLKGVSNFAVDAMTLATADASLDAPTKKVLKRLFTNEVDDVKPQQLRDASLFDELKKDFPNVDVKVLQTVVKFLEGNFGATTVEDLDGLSDWAVNGLSLAKKDKTMDADAKITLQLLFQTHQTRRLDFHMSSSSSAPPHHHDSTTTTTTTMAATTTTMAATTTTMAATTTTMASGGGGGDSGGDEPKDTTTTTTTMAPVTTVTMAATIAFNAKFSVAVSDTAAFLENMGAAKMTMADAIVAGNTEISSTEMVVINSITAVGAGGRRLGERRLAAGELEVDYTVNFPNDYKGTGITSANTDWSKMTESIKNNKHGVKATVASGGFKWTAAPTCSGGGCGLTTTAKMTTTEAAEVTGGAVTAKQLATSVAAVLLVKLLSGM